MTDTAPARATRPHGLRTRQRILDAAVDCLVELGYAGTTTVAVQARAGVTRGSLLHQFPSRNGLLVSAVTHLGEARFDALVEQLRSTADRKDRVDAMVDALWDSFQGPLFIAATELWVAARTDPELRGVLEPAERELGRRFRAGWDEVFGPVSRNREFGETFDLLFSSMRGVAITRHFDSSNRRVAAHLRTWKRLAHQLLDEPATMQGEAR